MGGVLCYHPRAVQFDLLPSLVADFVARRSDGRELLAEVRRHVHRVSSPYPDAYFALGRKTPDAVDDLGNRVFATCARTAKGRFPFMGRPPFTAYVDERFEGRVIRYHSFYAKLSIAREILRADYAHNLSSHPMLRWRADLYDRVGDVLKRIATPEGQATRGSTRWSRAATGPVMTLGEDALVAFLRRLRTTDVEALVTEALARGGPATRAGLTHLLEAVLGGPPDEVEDEVDRADPLTAGRVRDAVAAAWADLGEDERTLFRELARGLGYDEIVAAHPQFKHKVAVNRALARITGRFREALVATVGGDAAESATPGQLAEAILDVLQDMGLIHEEAA